MEESFQVFLEGGSREEREGGGGEETADPDPSRGEENYVDEEVREAGEEVVDPESSAVRVITFNVAHRRLEVCEGGVEAGSEVPADEDPSQASSFRLEFQAVIERSCGDSLES